MTTENSRPIDEKKKTPELKMIAWEVTGACNLDCIHCRAAAVNTPPPGELTTEEAIEFLDQVACFSKPIIILTGGEPLMREDIFKIASYGTAKGLRMVMSPNGTLLNPEITQKMIESGIKRVSVSLDGSNADIHDKFRRVDGAFDGAIRGINYLKEAGISFQINTTVTKHNLNDLQAILNKVKELKADAWHVFLLVPTGRAKEMKEAEISPENYEKTLNWLYDVQRDEKLFIKPTCAPHYYRIHRQRNKKEDRKIEVSQHGLQAMTRGCLGGITFCFVSHFGDVYPCGYFETLAGNIRKDGFKKIWDNAKVFCNLRNYSELKGRCGNCEYVKVCGGCRARALSMHGDYMAEEPFCNYEPKLAKRSSCRQIF